MDEPKSLDELFKEKLFRIPDYQRGYAWQREQLKDFWEDLVNLSEKRSHYTGVLTLKQIPSPTIRANEKEYWLIEDHSYKLYHVVDGQQRLTTFVIFLQAFVEFAKQLPENSEKADQAIYITDSLSVSEIQSKYLFKTKPTGDNFRTYKFGYTSDNPSYEYLRYRILGEPGAGSVHETFYTLNLDNAKVYFSEQCRNLFEEAGLVGLQDIYKTLTKRFLFNEYVINDDFDVFVAFETMNNRGKKLSDLELLKNRLIYLTTLYSDNELDSAERKNLRDTVNDAWKEAYHQLGRNKTRPLNDDDFLRAHWTMYFKYSRQTGRDYIRFLLEEQFTPQKVHKKLEREVTLALPEELRSESIDDDTENEVENDDSTEEVVIQSYPQLKPTEIRDFALSLKQSAVHWFNSFYAEFANGMSNEERDWIDRLNRVGMVYFRPLVMAVLKNEPDEAKRIHVFKCIERFIFIVFRLTAARANYRSSEFYNAAREFDRGDIGISEIESRLNKRLSFTFNADGSFRIDDFYNLIYKKFKSGSGYYGWSGLRYFLYEYELSLLSVSRQKKVDWSDLLKTPKDKVSIEHIYPQTETDDWASVFHAVPPEQKSYYMSTLGNLLLLSAAINSSLQNDSFASKKQPKYNAANQKTRNGYSDGSHSEIEVSHQTEWGPEQVYDRGMRLLSFMEERWNLQFADQEQKEKILFLGSNETAN